MLPISNPANLVVFGARMPHLAEWLRQFTLPSLASIAVTYLVLRLAQRRALNAERMESSVPHPQLSCGGWLTAYGIVAIGLALIGASALDMQLGLPTFICGVVTAAAVLVLSRQSPWPVIEGVAWSVLPLVAGLFVMVEALIRSGAIAQLSDILHAAVSQSVPRTAWAAGLIAAAADNVANNLPVGLIVGSVVGSEQLPSQVLGTMLIGVDLGPNLSVTGSLATILWLVALRREKVEVSAWHFLWLGLLVMPPALLAAVSFAVL